MNSLPIKGVNENYLHPNKNSDQTAERRKKKPELLISLLSVYINIDLVICHGGFEFV